MKITKFAVTILTSAMALVALTAPLSAAQLTDHDQEFLAAYEKVHHALVADDLAGATRVAADLGPTGSELAKSKSLEEARAAFAKVSDQAAKLAAGQPGYYVMHCPMKNKDWVQTSDKVANPYGGKGMISCGEIKK
ncbi:MAG TPA: hypothetical protein VIL63_00020 [Terriglobales bacterium]|jgi:hypothetical protein